MSAHAFSRYRARQQAHSHASAVFLSHVARCALEAMPDAGQREDFVDRCSVLLSAEEAAELRSVAGLPPLAPDPAQTVLAL